VILACGGFEGNAEMLNRYMGPRAMYLRPMSRGGYTTRARAFQMALDIGAAPCGDFGSCHASPMDPRSNRAGASDVHLSVRHPREQGRMRFADEGPGRRTKPTSA
jgi:tricarballylate dehydrogenase